MTETDPEALLAELQADNRSDGLPVIPPTDERIDAMLTEGTHNREDVILHIPTNFDALTGEKLAKCAVMAGCKPAYYPVVERIFDGLATWDNLQAPLSTTGGFWIASLVSGPIRDALDFNAGAGLFGPGYRANATVGRAVTLAFINVGGVYPGVGTMATHGHPGRYTYCFAERDSIADWEPFHVDVGDCSPGDSAVSVFTAHSPYLISEGSHTVPTAEDVVKSLGRGGAHPGAPACATPGETYFVLGTDHAGLLAEEYAKSTVKELLYEHCRLPYSDEPLLRSPADARIVVAGGASNMSSVIHTFTFGGDETTTKQIEF